MISRAVAITALVSLSGCNFNVCFDPGQAKPSVGATQDSIVGGTVDDANRSTVAVLTTMPSGSHGICTGTMIAKAGDVGYVLTAAHCATGTVDRVVEATDWRDCTPGGDASKCRATYVVSSWQSHPAYDPVHEKNDFAMVIVSGTTASTEVTPAIEGADLLAVGQTLLLSGFGRTYQGPNDPSAFQSIRHEVEVPIDALDTDEIGIDATTGHTACFGDSGGPAFVTVAGQRKVVGVTWAGDQNCAQVAIYGRVSSVYADFIAPIIAPALENACSGCVQGSLEDSTGCEDPLAACQGTPSCASLLACVEACDGTIDDCFFACNPPDIGTVVAFNQVVNCAACSSCSEECAVPACVPASSSASTTSSSSTGGASTTTSSSSADSRSSAAGTSSVGASGGTEPSMPSSTSASMGEGGSNPGTGGAGGAEVATPGTSSTSSGGKLCAPVHVGCSTSPVSGSDGDALGLLALAAAAFMAARRRVGV